MSLNPEQAGTIHVASIDFDKCLFFKGRINGEGKTEKQVLQAQFAGILTNATIENVFFGSLTAHRTTALRPLWQAWRVFSLIRP
jgi:hypothetical protein